MIAYLFACLQVVQPVKELWAVVAVGVVVVLLHPAIALATKTDEPRCLSRAGTAVVNFVQACLLDDGRLVGRDTPAVRKKSEKKSHGRQRHMDRTEEE